MRAYAKVSPLIWTGPTGKALRAAGPEAQVIALYLITCPTANMLGLYYLPLPTLCHETGLSPEVAPEALRKVCEIGFAQYDHDTEMVWVVEMARFQIDDQLTSRDKRIQGIVKELGKVQKCKFARDFYLKYREPFKLPEVAWWDEDAKPHGRPFEGPSEPLRSQEQEQEQEKHPPTSLEGGSASIRTGGEQPMRAPTLTGTKLTGDTCGPGADAGAPSRRRRKPSGLPPHLIPLFERFWSAWPKKVARADAEKAFGQIEPELEDALVDQMLAAIKVQADINRWDPQDKERRQYIPHPATWIRGKRWHDEVEPLVPSGPQYDELWECKACHEFHKTPKEQKGICPKKEAA